MHGCRSSCTSRAKTALSPAVVPVGTFVVPLCYATAGSTKTPDGGNHQVQQRVGPISRHAAGSAVHRRDAGATSASKIALIESTISPLSFRPEFKSECHARRSASPRKPALSGPVTNAERATDWRGGNNIAESIYVQMREEEAPPGMDRRGAGAANQRDDQPLHPATDGTTAVRRQSENSAFFPRTPKAGTTSSCPHRAYRGHQPGRRSSRRFLRCGRPHGGGPPTASIVPPGMSAPFWGAEVGRLPAPNLRAFGLLAEMV